MKLNCIFKFLNQFICYQFLFKIAIHLLQILFQVEFFLLQDVNNIYIIFYLNKGILRVMSTYQQMELDEVPKNLCELLITSIRHKFQYELNSEVYKVQIHKLIFYVI